MPKAPDPLAIVLVPLNAPVNTLPLLTPMIFLEIGMLEVLTSNHGIPSRAAIPSGQHKDVNLGIGAGQSWGRTA